MKEFFERYKAKIETDDLQRFGVILMEDLSAVLPGFEFVVHLLDTPQREAELDNRTKEALQRNKARREPETGRLILPVVFQRSKLAVINAVSPVKPTVSSEIIELLPTIVRLSLEKLLLYKINITDNETDLNNEDYFRSYVRKKLQISTRPPAGPGQLKPLRLGDAETVSTLVILLAEIRDFERLATEHGRLEAVRALKTLADWLKEGVQGGYTLARMGKGRLGLALQRMDLTSVEDLAKKTTMCPRPLGASSYLGPPIRLAFGLAAFPTDFAEELGQSESLDLRLNDLADQLLAKAELALQRAVTTKNEPVISFHQVLEIGGRVVQVLPYQRVVINLGQMAGAKTGQVFIIIPANKNTEVDYKGEIVLIDVQKDFSIGEIMDLRYSTTQIQVGDGLLLSQTALEDVAASDNLDPLLGLPKHYGFLSRLNEQIEKTDNLALMLIRVDGYEQYRTTMGHQESDRQLKAIWELVQGYLPHEVLAGRFSAESIVVYCPEMNETQANNLAVTIRDEIRNRSKQTCSLGLAVFPCGSIPKTAALPCAQKALDHAGFLGPGSLALFNALSLNISGDKKFEALDWAGAIQEYQLGLELDPYNINILNSLGVCYGYRKQFDQALEAFERVMILAPDNLMAHYNRGFVLEMAIRPEDALDSYRRAAELDPNNFNVLYQLGKTAQGLNRIDEAVDSFRRAAALDGRHPIVFRYLGQVLLQAGRPQDAFEAFKAAVRYDPEDASSISQLGILYLERGTDLDVALSLAKQSVDLDPTNSLFRYRLARTLAAAGDPASSETQYSKVLDLGRKSREVYYELGCVLRSLGRREEAVKYFKEALAVDPNFELAAEALKG
ncbi:MAG: tetratricopeptide repeat protein [Deltaproteobacteria bacterium]|nr:tetratricopeptide repeat protein [Deltaproteobacteria bacterium]